MLEDMTNDLESLREIISLCDLFLTIQDNVIYFLHQSAKDFLLAGAFHVIFPSGREEAHYEVFSRSLQAMSRTLQRNIYGLDGLGYPIEKVEQPDSDPLAVLHYSCSYWIDHLCHWNSSSSTNHKVDLQDGGVVDRFLRQNFLYWLEALSLCKSFSKGVVSMEKLETFMLVIYNPVILYI